MNAGLLYVTGIWLGYRKKGLRIFSGAAAGGLWSCTLALIPSFSGWGGLLITYGGVGPIMCRIAFGKRGGKSLAREMVSFAAVSVFVGGMMSQLYFHTGMGYVMGTAFAGGAVGGGLSVLLLLAVVVFLISREAVKRARDIQREKADIREVILKRGERSVRVRALLDTGNRLVDPFTKLPVSIGEEESFKPLFPEPEEETGIFLIPFHSIGGKGVLKGRLLDSMTILKPDGSPGYTEEGQVMVASGEEPLSSDGSYQLILHGDYVGFTASERKRRRKNGHQSIGSQQVSAENNFQYEESSVHKEK